MKFRVIASTAVIAALLSATACGTGNVANNAYGTTRTSHSVTQGRGHVGRTGVNRNYASRNYVGRNYANYAGNYDGIGTGRGMNDAGRGFVGGRSHAGSRLGNALHNTRNTGYSRMGRTSTGRIHSGVNVNYDGHLYDGTPNGITTARGTDGRTIAQSRDMGATNTRTHTGGAYRNQNNFQNTVYREQGNLDGAQNNVQNTTRNTARNTARNNTRGRAVQNNAAATRSRAVQNNSTAQRTTTAQNNTTTQRNATQRRQTVNRNTTNRNNGRTLVNNTNNTQQMNQGARNLAGNMHQLTNQQGWNVNQGGQVNQGWNNQGQFNQGYLGQGYYGQDGFNITGNAGSLHHLNQNGYNIANNARQMRGDTQFGAQYGQYGQYGAQNMYHNTNARNGYLTSDSFGFDGNVVRDGRTTTQNMTQTQTRAQGRQAGTHRISAGTTANRNVNRAADGVVNRAANRNVNRNVNRTVNNTNAARIHAR